MTFSSLEVVAEAERDRVLDSGILELRSICNVGVIQLTSRCHVASESHKPSNETMGFIKSFGQKTRDNCGGCGDVVVVVVVVVAVFMVVLDELRDASCRATSSVLRLPEYSLHQACTTWNTKQTPYPTLASSAFSALRQVWACALY